jgi:hypothetical protein
MLQDLHQTLIRLSPDQREALLLAVEPSEFYDNAVFRGLGSSMFITLADTRNRPGPTKVHRTQGQFFLRPSPVATALFMPEDTGVFSD